MNQLPHVHLVDDDPEIRSLVREYLEEEGFRVTTAQDGSQMRSVLEKNPANIVILDVRLPGESGLDLALDLRQTSEIPIIMLSEKDDVVDRVTGLEIGADDYISKPFHLRELLARIRSLIRRSEAKADGNKFGDDAGEDGAGGPLRFSGWILNRQRRELFSPDGQPVDLSAGEFNLLVAFAERPNRILSRDQLLDIVYNREANLYDRSIDVQIGRLRRKIEADPKRPALIKTVRGVGYMLTSAVTSD
jgi:two-component system, OmpR family, response regulator